jgi:hypothetical protein
MTEDEVNVLHLKAAQRVVDTFDEVLVRQAGIIRSTATPEDLGRDDETFAPPAKLLDRLAHHPFGVTACIRFGVVKEVDAGLVGRRHTLAGDIEADLSTIGDPGPERELAQLDACLT